MPDTIARSRIRSEIQSIPVGDDVEKSCRADVLSWINSGAELCRSETAPSQEPHIIAYSAVCDGDYFLLGAHIKSGLWLPAGGHVEPDETLTNAASRELREEFNLAAAFVSGGPVFLSQTELAGQSVCRFHVSVWFLSKGDRRQAVEFDTAEFTQVRWFHKADLPLPKCDPDMARFCAKIDPLQH